MFEVQDEIGRWAVESLQGRFPRAVPKSRDRYSSDPEAFDEFVSGLRESYSNQPKLLLSAIEHLSAAVERDPEFALAHATLSYVCLNLYYEFDPQRAWLERAEHHCRVATDPGPSAPRRDILPAHLSCGVRRGISSMLKLWRLWNRFWRCNLTMSGPTTGWLRFVCISDGFRKRGWLASRRGGRIQRLEATTCSLSISTAGNSRAQRRKRKSGSRTKAATARMLSGIIHNLRS